jgi:hypothetical protein
MLQTTKSHFEKFQVYCDKWRLKLGLINWALFYEHCDLEDTYARTFWRTSDHAATIQFCKKWDNLRPLTDTELERLAVHELCHVVMAPLISEAEYRYSTKEAIDSAEHSIVRMLEEVLIGTPDA